MFIKAYAPIIVKIFTHISFLMTMNSTIIIGNIQGQEVHSALSPNIRVEAVSHVDLVFVGKVTGIVDLKWSEKHMPATNVPVGRLFDIDSGLLEITYNAGNIVLLQGPCKYDAESQNSGFLWLGKTKIFMKGVKPQAGTKKTRKDNQINQISSSPAPPPNSSFFSVSTPHAIITQLSNKIDVEYGIDVGADGFTAVHVFRGFVVVGIPGKAAQKETVLQGGESAYVKLEENGNINIIVNELPCSPQCVFGKDVYSKHIDQRIPLGGLQKAQVDKELIGLWRSENNKSHSDYIFMGRAGDKFPKGVLRAVSCTQKEDGVLGKTSEWFIITSNVANQRFINVPVAKDQYTAQYLLSGWNRDLFDGYMLFKYQVDSDLLVVWPIDPNVKRRLIEEKKIRGYSSNGYSIFNAKEDILRSLLSSSEGDKLFYNQQPRRYKRVK